jgi:type II secretory pathway component PulM
MNSREKIILISGGVLSIILISYGWIWLPYQAELKTLQARKIEYQNDLAWMQQAVLQLKSTNKHLFPVLQQRLQNMSAKITQPDNKTLHISFEKINFNVFLKFLADIYQQHHLSADSISIENTDAENIKAQLTLFLE